MQLPQSYTIMSPKEKEVTAPADICFHKLLHREDKEDMSFKLVNELPSPAEILEQFPLPEKLAVLKAERDEEIKKVITGESNKFLVIIGPCSADNEDAVCDYANRLAKVQEKTKDRLHFIESFHGGVFSWKEKCLKPDARIYRILLKRYDLNPASCLFFDDREDNVVAACREGIHGVVFGPSVVEEILHNR